MHTILLCIDQKRNRRLLYDLLTKHYKVIETNETADFDRPFDLCLIEGRALNRCRQTLLKRKAEEAPVFLPVLLVTSRDDIREGTRLLSDAVDEVIASPIHGRELDVRVESLIRLRRLSLELKRLDERALPGSEALYHDLIETSQDLIRQCDADGRNTLQESEERYRTLFEAGPDAMFILDPSGKIIDFNKVAELRYGYSRRKLLGMTAADLAAPDLREKVAARIHDALSTGARFEWRLRRKDGSEMPVEIRALPVSIGGKRCILSAVRDITDRKRAEQELRLSEARFRALATSTSAAIFIYQGEQFVYVNPAGEVLTGYNAEELVGMKFWEIIHPEYAEEARARGLIPQRGESVPQRYDIKIVTKSGEERWVDFTAGVFEYLGKPAAIGTAYDVTERKRAKDEIRRSKARLEEAQRIAHVGSWEWIAATDTPTWSKELHAILEVDPDKPVPSMAEQDRLYTPESMDRMRRAVEKTLKTGTPYEIELERVREDGSRRWLLARGEPWLDDAGHLIGLRGTALNVTERKQAEEAIRSYLRQLVALHRVGTVCNRMLDMTRVSEEVLDVLEKIMDYRRGTVVVRDVSDGHLELLAHTRMGLDEAAHQAELERVRNLIRHKKGITRWVIEHEEPLCLGDVKADPRYLEADENIRSEMAVPLTVGEHTIGAINVESERINAFSNDDQRLLSILASQAAVALENARLFEIIRKKTSILEVQVAERTEQLTQAFKELESFSYSVSHDLRAPLRAIQGFAEIIYRRHRSALNEEARHYFNNILLAAERMERLIDDLLSYSRLGRKSIVLQAVWLQEALDPALDDLAALVAESGAQIDISADLPSVIGDHTLLHQIFTNLLKNALTYRREDVPLHITVSARDDDTHTVICVTDNGIGIAPEYFEKVFNVFQRLHAEDEYPGTGIGLAIVKKSVEMMNGSVWIESAEGEGSRFCIRLVRVTDIVN